MGNRQAFKKTDFPCLTWPSENNLIKDDDDTLQLSKLLKVRRKECSVWLVTGTQLKNN